MFIGHFALGFAAKKLAPKPSLGTYFIGAQFLDLLWPPFLLLGMEEVQIEPGNTAFTPLNFISYPFSHSLLMTAIWATLVSAIYYLLRRERRGAIVLWFVVCSHWILDLITHRADLPLDLSNLTLMGFGLWNSIAATVIVEGSLFLVGVILYATSTRAFNKKGTFALWSLVGFLLLIYLMNLIGPPPPDPTAIAYAGLSIWLLVAWGYWIDRNRRAIAQ